MFQKIGWIFICRAGVSTLAGGLQATKNGRVVPRFQMYVELQTHLAELRRLSLAVEAFCHARELGPDVREALQLSLDEVATNIILYAFPVRKDGIFSVELALSKEQVSAVVRDRGIPFNPLAEVKDPDITAPLEARPVGGLGVHFVKSYMDSIEYARSGEENILVLRKQLAPPNDRF